MRINGVTHSYRSEHVPMRSPSKIKARMNLELNRNQREKSSGNLSRIRSVTVSKLTMIQTNTSEPPSTSETHDGAKSAEDLRPNLVTDGFHVFEIVSLVLALPIPTPRCPCQSLYGNCSGCPYLLQPLYSQAGLLILVLSSLFLSLPLNSTIGQH